MNTNMTLEKRILSVLLTVIMVFSMVPLSVFAADGGAATVITSGGEVAFNVYKDAVAYANQHDGSTIKLQSDIDAPTYEDPADMPFITGNVTLDLNGKSINCVDIGSVSFDEEGEIVKDKAGTLTVTGSGSIGLLTMYCGALTLNSGTVEELRAEDFAVTVHITGGTVESLVLSLRWDDNATADISGGSVQKLDLGTGTVNITGGSHGSETASWGVNGGTLNISGGSFSALRLLVTSGKIDLTGGEFEYISTDPQAPFSEYQKLTMGSLLGDSCAFYSKDGSLVSADVLTLENVKVVADHEHTYKDGKCTTCGALCKHDRVDTAMGRCEVCGIQLEAEISAEGASPVFYTSFTQAWDALQPNRSDQVTVTLLKPRYDLGETDLYVQSNNIRLDLNSNVMFGTGKIVVSGAQAVFTVENGDMNEITVEAADGAVTVGEDCGSIKAVRVTSTDAAVTIQSGFFEKLVLPATDTESLKNVKLSGGEFDSISFNGTGRVAITDMLEAGYAFQDNKGTASGKAGALVPYGMSFDAKTYFEDLEVVKCGHSAVNEVKGYCNYCGKLYAGKITDKDGAVRYVESLQDSDFGNGNTVTLLQDITGTVTPGGSCTIELRGRSVGQINFAVQDGTLTLKGQGKIGTVTLGSGEIDSTLAIEDTAYWQRVKIGTLTINKTTNTKLSGGQFDKIERKDGGFVEALLADGYAYFDREWEMPEYAGGKTSLTKTYYIAEHSHWFIVNIEGETQCQDCGMPCHHTTIGEDGKCQDVCHRQIYTAVLTRADGTAKNYESFADAWAAAMTDSGSTLRLLCDVTLGEAEDGIIAQSGKFTLDLNSKTVSGEITNQLLTVSGTADITIRNGKLINTFNKDQTDINKSCANALAIDGGTVTLDVVELTAGHGFEGARSCAAYIFSGNLTVVNGTFTGLFGVADVWGAHPSVKITSATLHDGIYYDRTGITAIDYAGLKAFFADGSMLFDKDGKYIDVEDEAYWRIDGEGENTYVSFGYSEECVIKPHTHDTYVDGKCTECDYACRHDSGKNDREAGYFEKAICSVCHSEYGDYVMDQTMPTGEVKIKGRSFWQTFWYTISFGMFYNEPITVEITATDDSYDYPGFDPAKHSVKIEYFVSTEALDPEVVIKSDYYEYTGPFWISDDNNYVIYVKITDYAGNFFLASSNGHVVDTTAPLIDGMKNGGVYSFCGGKTITVTDKNIDKVTMDGTEITLDENGQYTIPVDSENHKIVVSDKAGNETTVWITVYSSHDFDPETDTCINCGTLAVAKVENGDISDRFATGDELFKALADAKYNGATVTLLTDLTFTENVSPSGDAPVRNDLIIDLNGKTLQGPENGALVVFGGAVRIYSSNGEGTLAANLCVFGANASLTMDSGIGEAERVMFRLGNLTIRSGRYARLNIVYAEGDVADLITLYGGSYDSIYLAEAGSATAEQTLGKGYRYDGVSYATAQGKKSLSKVSVIPCDHSDLNDFVCTGCGMEIFLSVEANGTTKLFETFESAIRYAEQNDGSTVKLLQDITLCRENVGSLISNYYIYLKTGTYKLDLAGKTLTIGDGAESLQGLSVTGGCNLTVTDTVGGGKINSSRWGEVFEVRSGSHLTIESGDCTELSKVLAWGSDSLTIKGGKFNCVASKEGSDSVSPFAYLADGCAFMLSSGEYANESNVESQYISGRGTMHWINGVTVVPAPLTIDEQPTDLKFYLTSKEDAKYVEFVVSSIGRWWGDIINVTFEKEDGTVIEKTTVAAYENMHKGLSAVNFTVPDSGSYRIKLELKGYELYSDTFNITVAECEHPGYDKNSKCTQCGCDLAAAIVKDGKTTGYVNFADALTAAQTDENKGCVLWLLTDVNGRVTVSGGDFKFSINGHSIGGLGVTKTAKLNIFSGTVNGTVTVAKTANLIASVTNFMEAVNDIGNMSSFINCVFAQSLNAKGSNTNLNNCTINGALNVSGNEVTLTASTVYGKTTVNNGGLLRFMGNGGKYGETLVKSGGGLEVYSNNTVSGTITAQSGSEVKLSGGVYTEIAAESGAKLTVSGGEFTNITVNGQHLIDCLAEGKAFEDMNNGFIIDGRVGIAGDVKVVDHTHTCVWKTSTHEKLCGCGYVEAVDTEAPVISGIDPENNHYGSLEFTVTDANDFTVWMDGEEITLVNGKYTMEPDNDIHLITATDIAGNTASFRFGLFKIYNVTLPTGAGYMIFHSDGLTVRHGNGFSFIVQFNKGYSRTEDFKVLVNGNKLDELMSDADSASFVVRDVSEDLVITIEGVADITAPEVEVSIRGNSFKEFLNRITFGLFFKQTQTVEVKAHDFGSGIRKVEYLLSETAFADKDAITGNWTELTLNDDRKAYFSIEPNQKAFVYVRVTDQSGNIAVVNTDGVVVYTDAEAITGAQTFTKNTDFDVVYKLNLNGNFVAKVYNGTEEIGAGSDYALFASGMLMLKNSYLRTLAAGEYTIRLTIKPMGENYADNSGNDAPADVVLKLTVEKKTPSIGHKESDGKIYDGKAIGMPTFDTDSDGAVTFEYKRADEDDTAYTTEAPKNVGKYTIRITTAETDTFKSASSTMEFEIQPKEITISDVKVADKTYDGTTNATITNAGTLSVNYDGDNLAIVIGKAAYDNKNVGADKAVSFTGFELSGSAAGNYKLIAQPASTTADITVKEITINGATVEGSKVYDGTSEAKITNAGTLSDNYDGENLTIVAGSAAYDDKNVGTGKTVTFTGFELSGSEAGNYKLIAQPTGVTADITVKQITIIGAEVEASRIYDGTTDATITNAGTPSVNYDGENLKVAAGKAAYDNKNVGKGKTVMFTGFALEGDAAANYKLTAQPESVTADITVKEIKIVDTAVEASKVYDGSTDAKVTAAGTFDGLIDGDKVDIVTGKAAYDDWNVGSGKTVAFSDFALSGDDAANYVLAAQPANTTASISAMELTIKDLAVKDKQYDGKNIAEIDGTPALVGVVDGDMLTLVNGVPTFDSVKIGKNIAISFTAFTLSGDSVTVGNYTLTQPTGITASIVEYSADGSEYEVNSNGWINKDFVITAKAGYKLSLTDTANGEWADSLTASDETDNGKLIFFVKNTGTGAISAAVTENYKIDKTAPTGEIKLNERTAFQKLINTITFGLFFKDDVNVKLTATDDASGVKSVLYFKSDRILNDEEVRAITDWTDNSDFDIEAKDMDKFIIYARIEDNAGNVTFIGSDGATFDTTAPEIVGVENGKTYYVTKKVAIDDENPESVTLNGEPVEGVFTLVGDKDATYVIRAVDKAGNVTEYTVYMKPISSITDAIAAITDENVKSSDAEMISTVERQILDIAEVFDDGESTDDEWNKLTEAAAKCKDLNKRIADVADEISRLTDAVNGYDIDKVMSADKADVEKLISDIDTLLDGDNLTDAERAALEALKGTARALLDRIAAAKDAAEADEIKAVDGITKDNVKLEDKEALEKADKALEGALRDFDGNYTEEENKDLETKLETVKAALAAIGNAEKAAEEIGKLPSADNAKLSDKSALDQVKKLLDGLTENEKAMLGKDAPGKVDALAEKIKKLAEEANSPKTGDTSNLALWIALLFISGGIVTGTTVASKKKKRSVK